MNREDELKIIEEMQLVAQQMRMDDIEENPDCVNEYFDCSACGKTKDYAGSVKYGEYRLCNDCVLLAETGFALKKIKTIHDLLKVMEDKRLEEMCEFIKADEKAQKN